MLGAEGPSTLLHSPHELLAPDLSQGRPQQALMVPPGAAAMAVGASHRGQGRAAGPEVLSGGCQSGAGLARAPAGCTGQEEGAVRDCSRPKACWAGRSCGLSEAQELAGWSWTGLPWGILGAALPGAGPVQQL